MNEQHDTTAPDAPTMPDFVRAFDALEKPIDVLVRRVKSLDYLIGMLMEQKADEFGRRMINEGFFETIASTTWDTHAAGTALEEQWLRTHNERCGAEMAELAENPKKTAEVLCGVRVPLMGGVR